MAGLFRPGAWAGLLSLAAVLGSGIPGATLQADPGVPTKSAVRGFTDVDGKTYFAIGLRARQAQGRPTASRDQIVLVDTSASQIGEHRTAQLAVVEAFLNNLPSTDRVQLFATDVQTRPLTEGFVAVGSDELRQGLDRLRTTIPLGAGNFGGALSTAIESATDRPTHVTYVGDGMSAANIIPQAELKEMLAQFTARRIPVHTYAVGPQLDLPMLCAASAQTGGMFGRDLPGSNATADGTQLAVATTHAVVYPSSISSSLSMVNPQVAPLRTDRLTYFLATAETAPKSFSVEVTTDTGKQVETFTEIALEESNSYLASLSRRATLDSGLAAVIAGDRMLAEIQDEFVTDVAQLLQEGQNALDNRDFAQADQIAETVKRIDPASVPAKAIANASRQLRVTTIAAQQPGQENANGSLLDNLDVEAPTPGLAGQVAGDNQLIGEIESRRKVRAEQMRLEVSNAIESARQLALDSPEQSLQLLKRFLGSVRNATDVDPAVRDQLARRLGDVIVDIRNRVEVREIEEIRRQEALAQVESQERLVQQMTLQEERLQQLIDRVRSLLKEGEHGNDNAYEEAEAVSRAAVDTRPGNGTAATALFTSEAAGQLNKAFRMRSLRADRFLETLYQVELSHVPFPDEPPIRWPAAEVWKALTERRRKWASVDLKRNRPSEERILAALDDVTEVEFIDTPLKDAMDFIGDLHGISIILDDTALAEEGIDVDEPINRVLSGITLRSVLKIMLEPLGLTYVIEDEVMKITTEIKAEESLSTRVYPVGDLVIPIQTPMSGGIGQGLGGAGGFGGGGGQFGGGGGGQFGGGGGGFFSLPATHRPESPANQIDKNAAGGLKKKLR